MTCRSVSQILGQGFRGLINFFVLKRERPYKLPRPVLNLLGSNDSPDSAFGVAKTTGVWHLTCFLNE